MSVVLLSPAWLWLALLAPVVWIFPTRTKRVLPAILRSVVIVLIAIALARPAMWRSDARERAVFVVDQTASVDPAARARALALVSEARRALPERIESTLVMLGSAAGATDPRDTEVVSPLSGSSSISAALRIAALSIPIGERGSITLVTDGCTTDRNFGDALVDLEERGIPLHTVALERAQVPPVAVSFTSTEPLRIGFTSALEVVITGRIADGTIQIFENGNAVTELERVNVEARARVTLDYEPAAAGFVTLEARLTSAQGDSSIQRTFAVQDPLRIAYFGGRVGGGGAELGHLIGRGFSVDVHAPSDVLAEHALDDCDLVVLDDAPAASITSTARAQIARNVRERGLGLVMSGGEASFGPGGWADTEIAELLPVDCVQKEEKRDPSTTLVLIIDTSGSMGGERIQLAKEVARLAMARLLPHDKVGIVEFYGTKRWAAPIQPASNAIELQRAINRMDAEGGTVILPAIEEAFYGLQNVETRYKHVLILTDGGVENGAFEPLLRRMAEEGMAVSTVLIGPEAHSEFLVDLANWGKGRFYSVPDRFNLPEILLKQPTSSRLPAYKSGEFSLEAHGGSAWWTRTDRTNVPPIAGYVETTARAGAEVLLEVQGERDPLLATWCVGLGRVTTLATELVGPGTVPWRDWKDYGRWLARVLARTANESRAHFAFDAERRDRDVYVIARRTNDGASVPQGNRLSTSGAVAESLAFVARSNDEFVAHMIVDPNSEVRLRCSASSAAGEEQREPEQYVVSNAHADRYGELAVDPVDAFDLTRAAQATGGDRIALDALATFVPRAGGPAAPVHLAELAPFVFALALLAYLFEIWERRRNRRTV